VPHVLHLLTDPADALALAVIRVQAADPETTLSVVLLHGAGGAPPADLPGEIYHLAPREADAPAAGGRTISASGLLDLIFIADSVVTW
jgi:hypothetical protein